MLSTNCTDIVQCNLHMCVVAGVDVLVCVVEGRDVKS